jgi:hypothetical protein
MTDHSRRTFLAGAGVAATAVTVTALAPGAALAAAPKDHEDSGPTPEATLVAYVRDARTGHITIMSGDREIEVTDKALARRLARLSG